MNESWDAIMRQTLTTQMTNASIALTVRWQTRAESDGQPYSQGSFCLRHCLSVCLLDSLSISSPVMCPRNVLMENSADTFTGRMTESGHINGLSENYP